MVGERRKFRGKIAPTAKHFTSWLCLAPGNKISGSKVLSSRTRRSSSRAAALLRLAATTIGRNDTALGAFYRRLAGRIGKQEAVTATARKIAVLFYNALRFGMVYRVHLDVIGQLEAPLERTARDPAMQIFAVLRFSLLALHHQDVKFLRDVEVGVCETKPGKLLWRNVASGRRDPEPSHATG